MPYCEIFLLQVTAEPQQQQQKPEEGEEGYPLSISLLGTWDWGGLSPTPQNPKHNKDLALGRLPSHKLGAGDPIDLPMSLS